MSDLNQKSFDIKLTRKTFFFNYIENMRNSVLAINEKSNVWLNNTTHILNNVEFKKSHSNYVSQYFLTIRK